MENKSLFWQKLTLLQSPKTSAVLATALCIGVLGLTGCNEKDANVVAPVAAAVESVASPVSAVLPTAYTPPTAAHLYEMVAPIALYPDKLVAQVLAGSTYPLEITQADHWLLDNSTLSPGQRSDAVALQGWDPSVKSLTAFKHVLDQLANNLPWTTALGLAFYNNPDDVLNAIQVMRQRASHAGRLKSDSRQLVAVSNITSNYPPSPLTFSGNGGAKVAPQPQLITIVPAQANMVYVPSYDPQQIYGPPVAVYPGYVYTPPVYATPNYSQSQVVTTSALTFGIGVVVGAALEHHDWGWHAWDLNWGQPNNRVVNRPGFSHQQGVAANQPAITYNRTTYVSRSNTVVNNNVRNTLSTTRQRTTLSTQRWGNRRRQCRHSSYRLRRRHRYRHRNRLVSRKKRSCCRTQLCPPKFRSYKARTPTSGRCNSVCTKPKCIRRNNSVNKCNRQRRSINLQRSTYSNRSR